MVSAFEQYEDFDAIGLAELVRRKEVAAEEMLEAAITRAEARNPALNAIVMELYDFGRQAIADGLPDGPLRGAPYLIKDLGAAMAGIPTTGGSRFMADVVPAEDSETVKRLKAAGLAIFGKTNTCEFGMSITCEPQFYGPTINPWNAALTPGGSSGGAASAVAARIVPAAHASDGFGSIRVPAACCGLVGMKPTRGRNSFAPSLGERIGGTVAEHSVSRTVRDHAALLDATGAPAEGIPILRRRPRGRSSRKSALTQAGCASPSPMAARRGPRPTTITAGCSTRPWLSSRALAISSKRPIRRFPTKNLRTSSAP